MQTFRSLGWWWVQASNMAANRSPVPTNTASTLGMSMQIFWEANVPSELTTIRRPTLIKPQKATLALHWSNGLKNGGQSQTSRLPIFWLPRATRNWSPSLEGRSVLVRTTVSGPILCSKSITWTGIWGPSSSGVGLFSYNKLNCTWQNEKDVD